MDGLVSHTLSLLPFFLLADPVPIYIHLYICDLLDELICAVILDVLAGWMFLLFCFDCQRMECFSRFDVSP